MKKKPFKFNAAQAFCDELGILTARYLKDVTAIEIACIFNEHQQVVLDAMLEACDEEEKKP